MNLTVKQEAFVQAYIENGGNAAEAYRKAYNAEKMKADVIYVKACELLKSGKVAVRVKELRDQHAKRHEITVDRITEMLLEDRDLAKKVESPAAAVSASMGLAKLHGHLVERVKGEGNPLSVTHVKMVMVDPYEETEH